MKIFIKLVLISIVFCGCKSHIHEHTTYYSKFENWKNDTIRSINNSRISFRKDTGFLEISEKITLNFSDQKDVVYSILSDYNQIPRTDNYLIQYTRVDLFTVSRVPQLNYERVTVFKNIKLINDSIVNEYDYVRGRIK